MAAAAASGVVTEFTFAAQVKGEAGNLITIINQASAITGATTIVESGNAVTVIPKSSDGTTVDATNAEIRTAINAGRLVTASLASAITGANTGAAFSGTALAGGTSGAAGYDDLAAATGDGWILTNVAAPVGTNGHGGIDVMEKVDSLSGRRVRVAADAATGATLVCKSAYKEENRKAALGHPRSLYKIGATGANEYIV